MSDPTEVSIKSSPPSPTTPTASQPWFRTWMVAVALLVVAFGVPLYHWVKFGLESSVFSHILLIPLVSGYLAWTRPRGTDRTAPPRTGWAMALAAFAAGLIAVYFAAGWQTLPEQDRVALWTTAFVFGFFAVCAWKLPGEVLRANLFPIGFVILMVPLPTAMHRGLETALQHGSADAAYGMLRLAGTPVLREGLVFHIPGISLEVAPQCSGIRSTLALFITSIVAGYLFLHSPVKRIVLTLFVIPLAVLRNGFRVFTIAELCVHYGPQMVHTPIHHQGGPIFFALSLVPFSLLLWWLYRSEKSKRLRS